MDTKEHVLKTLRVLFFAPSDVQAGLREQAMQCLTGLSLFVQRAGFSRLHLQCLEAVIEWTPAQQAPQQQQQQLEFTQLHAAMLQVLLGLEPNGTSAVLLNLLCRRLPSTAAVPGCREAVLAAIPDLLIACKDAFSASNVLHSLALVLNQMSPNNGLAGLPHEHPLFASVLEPFLVSRSCSPEWYASCQQ